MNASTCLPATLILWLFWGNLYSQSPPLPTSGSHPDCTVTVVPPVTGNISAKLAWQGTNNSIFLISTPIIANLDPQSDDIPEIICEGSTTNSLLNVNQLYFFRGDGSNQNAPRKLDIPNKLDSGQAIAIGDLDQDGIPELITICEDNLVRVYRNYDPLAFQAMELWLTSDLGVGIIHASPSLADFDADGTPEIYAGNAIFKLDLADGTNPLKRVLKSPIGPAGRGLYSSFTVISTAADLLTPADCGGDPDCDGLELAAGYEIYAIDLDLNDGDGYEIKTVRSLQTLAPGFNWRDGLTAVSDMDLDGIPDVVVSSGRGNSEYGVYVWNKDGLLQFMPHFSPGATFYQASGGFACIANVFDDRSMGATKDLPEILVTSSERLYALNLNAATLSPTSPSWWSTHTSDRSGFTGATTFDFNGDGIREIVYRDESRLRILYGGHAPFPAGVDSMRNWYTAAAYSLTGYEFPIVADIDNDGSAEIVVTGSLTPDNNFGKIKVFEHATAPWKPCRNLWNQANYHVTNVNDDLKVPAFMQKHWLELPGPGSGSWPLNNYLSQKSKVPPPPNPQIFVPDASLAVDSVRCSLDSFDVYLSICNLGSAELPAQTPIAFYAGDPRSSAAPLLFPVLYLTTKIDQGLCLKTKFTVPATFNQSVFLVVNDDGSTPRPYSLALQTLSTSQYECHFENNIAALLFPFTTAVLDLGPDLELCQNSTVMLNASSGFTRYLWQNGSTDSTFTATQPGKYWVDAWDICGQKKSDTVQINILQQLAFELGPDQKICIGDSLQLQAAVPNATISWTESTSTPICSNCPFIWVKPSQSTIYKATASSGNCIFTDSVLIEIAPTLLVAQTPVAPKCFGESNGQISIDVSGGAAPFDFLWSVAGAANAPLLQNLAAGTYALTITDQNGCSSVQNVELLQPPALTVAQTPVAPKCFGESSGQISIDVSGGVAPFDFLWSMAGAANAPLLQNLPAGTYTLTITDQNGCSSVQNMELLQPPALTVTQTSVAPNCFGESSGQISLDVSGGAAPFDFLWSVAGAANAPLLQNLPAGTYALTITDRNGCSSVQNVELLQPTALTVAQTPVSPKCFGESSGQISIDVSGGAAPFDFLWSVAGAANAPMLQNLPAGTYALTITDQNGCSSVQNVELQESPALTVTQTPLAPRCFGESSGQISIDVSGGAAPFDFLWSVAGAANAPLLQNLPAGTYALTITDQNGCSSVQNVELQQPTALTVAQTPVSPKCFGESSGQISIDISGGAAPFDFLWSVAGAANAPLLQNLPAGTYALTITDQNGCSSVQIVDLLQPPALTIAQTSVAPKCFGESSGQISIDVSGGAAPFDFLWSVAGAANAPLLQNLPAGTYALTITDQNGCSSVQNVDLLQPPALTVAQTSVAPKCFGESSGQISIDVSGGAAPFDFLWSVAGAANAPLLQNLPAGTYALTITDQNGCSSVQNVELQEPPALTVAQTPVAPRCFGESSGQISIDVSGGAAPFDFLWSLAGAANAPLLQNLPAGTYALTITDQNGCSSFQNVELQEPPALTVAQTPVAPNCFGESSGQISIDLSGGAAPFNFLWSLAGAANAPLLQNLPAGTYALTITDQNGCTSVQNVELQEPPALTVQLTISDTLIAPGELVVLTAIPSPDSSFIDLLEWQPESYLGDTHEFSVQVYPTEDLEFSVKITDQNGCTAMAMRKLAIEKSGIYIPNTFAPDSYDNSSFTVFGGSEVRQLRWLRVFDRWGELVFENKDFVPNDLSQGWDGTFRNKPAPSGVYLFMTQVEYENGTMKTFQGDLLLIR